MGCSVRSTKDVLFIESVGGMDPTLRSTSVLGAVPFPSALPHPLGGVLSAPTTGCFPKWPVWSTMEVLEQLQQG